MGCHGVIVCVLGLCELMSGEYLLEVLIPGVFFWLLRPACPFRDLDILLWLVFSDCGRRRSVETTGLSTKLYKP